MVFMIVGSVSSVEEADEINKIAEIAVLGRRIMDISSFNRKQTEESLLRSQISPLSPDRL